MNTHLLSVHATKCQFCHSKFMTNDEMNAHISKVHAKIKCQFCPSKFLTNKDLDQHITQAHATTEEKPKLTYAELIAEALSNTSEGMLVLSDIYKAISASHPYYRLENPNWQNS